jgi:two-component sensor histidine kinase
MSDSCGAAAIQDARNRVLLMMNLYDKLYRSTDFRNVSSAEYLDALIGEISITYSGGNRIKIQKEVEDFQIDTRLLFPAGMIINELISNAFKYAFPPDGKGTVKVFFTRPDENLVSLIVTDDGIGIGGDINLQNTSGFGLTLVNMLVGQLKGNADIIRNRGTTFRITFPL